MITPKLRQIPAITLQLSRTTRQAPNRLATFNPYPRPHQHSRPQPAYHRTLHTTPKMSSTSQEPTKEHFPNSSGAPGEAFEPRQTATSDDFTPDPSKSLPLSPARQALIDDIIALYSCQPTVKRVERYTPDCVYDDQFVYANDRYKMAGQWFALPKLFKASVNEGYEVFRNDRDLIQFKNEQVSIRSIRPHRTAPHRGV